MNKTKLWEWVKAALIRAAKTVCQTALALIGTNQFMTQVDWRGIASAALLAGIASILTSVVTGLPEVEMNKELKVEDDSP